MEVFLFPLVNVTLFPRTIKPLNIFEPRYLAMMKEAAATKTPIALGYIEDPSKVTPVNAGEPVSFVREIAGYGYVQIIEERVNGTLLVFLQGQGKLRLGKVIDSGTPYIVCESSIIPEKTILEAPQKSKLNSLQKILTRWIHTHISDPQQQDTFMRNLVHPEEVVGAFASYLVRDYDLQQMVLEFNDINEKVLFLHRLMESNELTV
ncbi:LON peptidase substrate-binding domain-containing protein [Bdellovibrio svalbardensis]|uniref:LON peptidase substrate-binding domain-containing protein n=1 Tax=Bdellovibrio svalbardensis TaxID=2972972 RepID=A0ABT6DJF4_9BACT|nr:LON peptidase substrate-binding domain-containing protein [Bdellovibrio svalbardensis]MDG0816350.1 LON peptidase substrate-binding domain-containing protein [Bdellovibrio svalbardensis]